MQAPLLVVLGVAALLAIVLVALILPAHSTPAWAIVGMLAAVLLFLAYDLWRR